MASKREYNVWFRVLSLPQLEIQALCYVVLCIKMQFKLALCSLKYLFKYYKINKHVEFIDSRMGSPGRRAPK